MTLDNNSIDKIYLKKNALVITKHDSIHFDQLSGKNITADFIKGDIYEIFINGNAQTLYYPSEDYKDSLNTITKTLRVKIIYSVIKFISILKRLKFKK